MAEVISWFTTFDDPYRITPVAFVLTCIFIGLFALNEHLSAEQLRADSKPHLTVVFGKGQLYDSLHNDGTLRILRVGILNSGESVANVAVKVARILPQLSHVFPMQELQQTHEEAGTSKFTVNKSNEPLVFVDVIHQKLHRNDGIAKGVNGGVSYSFPFRKGEAHRVEVAFADGEQQLKEPYAPYSERYKEQYLIWLVIDGAGAERERKFVLARNSDGQYDMTLAPFG